MLWMCKQNKVVKFLEEETPDQSEGASFNSNQPEHQLLNCKLSQIVLCLQPDR